MDLTGCMTCSGDCVGPADAESCAAAAPDATMEAAMMRHATGCGDEDITVRHQRNALRSPASSSQLVTNQQRHHRCRDHILSGLVQRRVDPGLAAAVQLDQRYGRVAVQHVIS
jgi:hypothetical protein